MSHDLSEGAKCPEQDCNGTLQILRHGDCTCHIAPPCEACMRADLCCQECGVIAERK